MLQILWLIAMAVLIGCSAFFSASEAALFSMRPADRRTLASGNPAQRAAAQLLSDADRVLSAILFWNLVVNIAYFALASTFIDQRLPDDSRWRWPLRIGSLLLIIFFSEMLPKTLGVLIARQLSTSLSLPLSLMVRLIDPLMPVFQLVMLLSQRLVWPSFQPESALEAADLERAIELSTDDAALLDQEQTVLRNIVALSELRADESMRPRTQLQTFRPPVKLTDLEGKMTQSGYLFITEDGSENIRAAVRLQSLWSLHPDHLEAAAEPVVYVPWCASLADTLALLRSKDRDVAAVVNEWGETIGAITIDDVHDVVFTDRPSRSQRLLNREPIQLVRHGLWLATGMTNVRQLGEYFELDLPRSHRATIGGVVQECLQRIPRPGDRCQWGPFDFVVVEPLEDGQMMLHVRRAKEDDTA